MTATELLNHKFAWELEPCGYDAPHDSHTYPDEPVEALGDSTATCPGVTA